MAKESPKFHGFDWDDGNRTKNRIKHGVSEAESEEIFFATPLVVQEDLKHSATESRFFAFGITKAGRLLTVVFTKRRDLIRIISARDMHKLEREFYKAHEKNS